MIRIYCLIDPRTTLPFYVGATKTRITSRLSGHLNEIKAYPSKYWNDKHRFINEIKETGYKVQVRLLQECSLHDADYYERFFYDLFISYGYTLLQSPPSHNYKMKLINEAKGRDKKLYRKQVRQGIKIVQKYRLTYLVIYHVIYIFTKSSSNSN